MDSQEAQSILKTELGVLGRKPYPELVSRIGEEFHFEKQGPSGAQYQVEILIAWDSAPNEAIRVLGSISDGGWRSFVPLTESLLCFPGESVLHES